MKFCKLINNTLEFAPKCTANVSNYNVESNAEMLLQDGWKPLIEAEREEDHIYSIRYQELTYIIKEILIDVTEQREVTDRIAEIEKRIEELEKESVNELLLGNTENIKIYNNVIKGLKETKKELEQSIPEPTEIIPDVPDEPIIPDILTPTEELTPEPNDEPEEE